MKNKENKSSLAKMFGIRFLSNKKIVGRVAVCVTLTNALTFAAGFTYYVLTGDRVDNGAIIIWQGIATIAGGLAAWGSLKNDEDDKIEEQYNVLEKQKNINKSMACNISDENSRI